MGNVAISESPILQFLNNAGQVNAGGSLLTQVGGVNYPTYQDPLGVTALPNPIPLNSRGEVSNSSGVSSQLFLVNGVTYTFTLFDVNGNQLWTANNVIALAPVAVGNLTDEKGSGGTFGFAANVDFTPGVTTQLTLSQSYVSASNLWVAFDGDEQAIDSYSLSGMTLSFNVPIPVGVNKVYVKGGSTLSIGVPSNGTVTDASVAAGTRLYNRLYDWFDVKDPAYGVKGDGVTNDTAAIQAVINAAATNGVHFVYFPAATYLITAQLTVPNGVSLIGVQATDGLAGTGGAVSVEVTTIKAGTGFPISTPMIAFANQWCGRFENFVIDGNNIATCGIIETGVSYAVHRNIMLTRFGNASSNDVVWNLVAFVGSNQQGGCAGNLFENIDISNYTIAAGTAGFQFKGTFSGGNEYAITENTFINCTIGAGAGAVALAVIQYADNNWFYGCNFSVTGASAASIAVRLGYQASTSQLVAEHYFFGCAFVTNGGTSVAASYNSGPSTFFGCYIGPTFYNIGPSGLVNFRSCTFNDQLTQNVIGIASQTVSPYTYTNSNPFPVQLFFGSASATVSAVAFVRNGVSNAIPNVVYSVWLEPGDAATITFTGTLVLQAYQMA